MDSLKSFLNKFEYFDVADVVFFASSCMIVEFKDKRLIISNSSIQFFDIKTLEIVFSIDFLNADTIDSIEEISSGVVQFTVYKCVDGEYQEEFIDFRFL